MQRLCAEGTSADKIGQVYHELCNHHVCWIMLIMLCYIAICLMLISLAPCNLQLVAFAREVGSALQDGRLRLPNVMFLLFVGERWKCHSVRNEAWLNTSHAPCCTIKQNIVLLVGDNSHNPVGEPERNNKWEQAVSQVLCGFEIHLPCISCRVPVFALNKRWSPWGPEKILDDDEIIVPQMAWTARAQHNMPWELKSDKGQWGGCWSGAPHKGRCIPLTPAGLARCALYIVGSCSIFQRHTTLQPPRRAPQWHWTQHVHAPVLCAVSFWVWEIWEM